MTFRTDAPASCGHPITWLSTDSGPKAQPCACGNGNTDADPRVVAIRAIDPDFNPAGKSDAYLDTYLKARSTASAGAATTTEDAAHVPHVDTLKEAQRSQQRDAFFDASDASQDGRLDRVEAARDLEREAARKGGVPKGAMTRDGIVRAAIVQDAGNESPLDRAERKRDAEREAAHTGGVPAGALTRDGVAPGR